MQPNATPIASEESTAVQATPRRLASIDALRGFDMFWIIGGKWPVLGFFALFVNPVPDWLNQQSQHVEWEGFSAWDLIMPLFLFVSGVSMPFSFAKWAHGERNTKLFYIRLARRVLLLWVLGMVVQGNLLKCDLSQLRLYSNTLQSIASGYLVAAILLTYLSVRGQAIATGVLLFGYWILLSFVPFGGHPAGTLEPTANLALHVDDFVLGRFSDGTTYTWVLSSIGFAASVLLGVFGGHILRSDRPAGRKAVTLAASGLGCLAAGWIWSFWHPIIKHIWSSSMVLWAGGWSYLLLAGFYWVIDVKGFRRPAFPFIVIGTNAIAVYVVTHLIRFVDMAEVLVGNLVPRLGIAGPLVLNLVAFLIPWLILLYLYRKKTFIKV